MESLGGENSLYLVFNNVDPYIEENNENKYLIFASTDKINEALENYTEIWVELKVKLKQQVVTNQLNIRKILLKSNLNQMMIYLWVKY